MIRTILYMLFCICIILFIYIGFFKKDPVEKRLDELSRDTTELLDESIEEKKKKNISFQFIRVPQKVRNDIIASGIMLRVEEFIMIWITLALFPPLIFYIFTHNIITSVSLAILMGVAPPVFIKNQRKKRLKLFGTQLGDALPLVANGLRSGFSFEQAMKAVATDMPNPIAQEFARVCRELAMGVSLENVLTSLTERTENGDMELLTSAVLIQRKAGGNLAEILDTVSNTIRERIRLKNHVNTLTAQGRYSGILVGSIPIILLVVISNINPDYMSVFFETLYGYILLAVAALLEITAFFVIKKMITLE